MWLFPPNSKGKVQVLINRPLPEGIVGYREHVGTEAETSLVE